MPHTADEIRLTREFDDDPVGFLNTYPVTTRGLMTAQSGGRYAFYFSPTHHFQEYHCVQLRHYREKTFSSDAPVVFGYWLTQGAAPVEVPINPKNRDFIFTNDLSGCSICVDKVAGSDKYKVYHVNDDSEDGNLSIQFHWRKEYFENPARGVGDRLISVLNNREYMFGFLDPASDMNEYKKRNEVNRCSPVLIYDVSWQVLAQRTVYEGKDYREAEHENALFRLRLAEVITRQANSLPQDVLAAVSKQQWFKKAIGKLD